MSYCTKPWMNQACIFRQLHNADNFALEILSTYLNHHQIDFINEVDIIYSPNPIAKINAGEL